MEAGVQAVNVILSSAGSLALGVNLCGSAELSRQCHLHFGARSRPLNAALSSRSKLTNPNPIQPAPIPSAFSKMGGSCRSAEDALWNLQQISSTGSSWCSATLS